MEAIYAGLITVLFGAWIWDLKSQVDSVRRVHPAGRGHHPVMRTDPSEMISHPSHVVKPNPSHVPNASDAFGHQNVGDLEPSTGNHHINRNNGVPVWVIE